ncbi:MAG: alkaline phosphatase family protein, partial [Ignavibacteriaceae bacterium]|nr:alkaline phosphatase family protein [Ignavibacteriaceae bacterium]
MKNKLKIILVILSVLSGISSAQMWRPDHVVIVIEENHAFTQIVGSTAAPYINSLLLDSTAAIFSQSYGLTHPSQPNYLMFFSGSNQGVIDDNVPAINPFNTSNLGNSLINAGFTFIGYSEDLPSVGYNGASSNYYARKHSPWTNWQGSTNYPIPLVSNQPMTAFPSDYSTLPNVSVVIPNLIDDMHNGTDPTTITNGDSWLNTHLDGYIQWAKTHNSLFILTFDEDNSANQNRILTFFIGSGVKQGTYSQNNTHYNFLRMLEDMYSLPYSGASSAAVTIDYCWQSALPVELSSFTAKYIGKVIDLKWETKTEINLDNYTIERSTDNKNFQIAGEVKAKGNSVTPLLYKFNDTEIEPGTYYYRLKMIDMDGT